MDRFTIAPFVASRVAPQIAAEISKPGIDGPVWARSRFELHDKGIVPL